MEPRPLLELSVQQAIASLLQKRWWWVKWQDAELRRKWLDEIEHQLLLQSFAQTLVGWEHGRTPVYELTALLRETNEPEASAKRTKWLQDVVTELSFDRDEEEDDDDDVVDDDEVDEEEELDDQGETSELSPEERALAEKVAELESYAQVKWTVNQLLFHEKMRELPVETWTAENTREAVNSAMELSDPTLDPRAVEFVLAVRSGVDTQTALHLPADSALLSQTRLSMLQMHCEKIHRELEAVRDYITKVIDQTADNEGLSASLRPEEMVISPAGISGVWISDNLVSEVVATAFKKEVAQLENVADDQKDWHPNSNQQVLDLVHPSLFCCVFGQTKRVAEALDPSSFATPAEQMGRLMFASVEKVEKVEKPDDCDTAYQWIPTDFLVQEAEGGGGGGAAVRILSYINNLHPEQYEPLYDWIGKIFGQFVPMFERILSSRAESPPRSTFPVSMYEFEPGHGLPRRPTIPDVKKLPKQPLPVSLKGKTLQAIVKIAEIVLTPDNPQYPGGSWHIEGTNAEKIVGTGIYYFACENIKESRLSFRAEVEQPPYQQHDHDGVAAVYGLFNEKLLVQVLGAVQTTEGRCVVFPNSHQHQVQPFELEDPSKPGVRKILAFFLVDPDNPVPSTSVIPPQQREWFEMTQQPLLKRLKLVETVEENVRSMLRSGMSMEEAKEHRLKLMAERAAPDDDHVANMERYFSLCEH